MPCEKDDASYPILSSKCICYSLLKYIFIKDDLTVFMILSNKNGNSNHSVQLKYSVLKVVLSRETSSTQYRFSVLTVL